MATQTDTLMYQLFDLTTHLAAIHAAPQVGWAQPTVTEWVRAARVAKNLMHMHKVFDKPRHLSEIHAAPQELWPVFVEARLIAIARELG